MPRSKAKLFAATRCTHDARDYEDLRVHAGVLRAGCRRSADFGAVL